MDLVAYNREAWNGEVARGNIWTRPVDHATVEGARRGSWRIVLTPTKAVPPDWFPPMRGLRVLCLASGGGQQGPILSAAGALVTVFDNSPMQLEQDRTVALREGLDLRLEQGDMRDLRVFADESFDLVVHPVSNSYVDDVLPVWREAFRVLRGGGSLLSGFCNPVEYLFDLRAMKAGQLVVRHRIPYSDLTSLDDAERKELILDKGEPLAFGHTLTDQIQGQIAAGFWITGLYEDNTGGGDPLDEYIDTCIATRAWKPRRGTERDVA
jgi:SAM-dependent methyltransferase